VFILRMRYVPLIDASGVAALSQVIARCRRQGTKVILSGLREQPRRILAQMHVDEDGDGLRFARDFAEALSTAQAMLGEG
jgi:SulP family sulfate permease